MSAPKSAVSRRAFLQFAGAGAASAVLGTFAAPSRAADASAVVETLADGATLVTLPEPDAPGVVWDAFFRVGLGEEGQYKGIRSLLTRCWIGDSKWHLAPLLAGDLQRIGASAGASCGPDWVEAWSACGPDAYAIEKSAQSLFTNIIASPAFEASAVEAARAETLRILRLRHDDLLFDVLDQVQSRAFGESPYGTISLGTADSLRTIPGPQVAAFYRRLFRPERAVFVAAGRITPAEARRWIIASLKAELWDEAAPAPPERPVPLAISPFGLRDRVLPRIAPAVCVALAYLAPGLSGGNGRMDYAALLVLDAALRGGKSSRLFALRDRPAEGQQPIGYEVRTVLTPGRSQSLWTAYVAGDRPAPEVRDRLKAALDAVATGASPLTADDIARAKTWCKARHAEGRQRLQERAFGVGWAETMGLGAAFDTDYALRIDAVSDADIARIARTVLLNGGPAIVYTRPLP